MNKKTVTAHKRAAGAIPIHYLKTADSVGLSIARFKAGQKYDGNDDPFHRDDHYIFFLIEQGQAALSIDFADVALNAPCVYYVLPGQVHLPVSNEAAQGWYLAAAAALIPETCRASGPDLRRPEGLTAKISASAFPCSPR